MEKKYIGHIAVDSGTVMVADPCYWIGKPEQKWTDFVEEISDDLACGNYHRCLFENEHDGKGIVIDGFGGDGYYPVYIETAKDGHKRLVIDFKNRG